MEFEAQDFFQKTHSHPKIQNITVFEFPPSSFQSQHFQTAGEVIAAIGNLETQMEIPHRNLYKRKKRGRYLYLQCRFCSSQISMNVSQNIRFITFKNQHEHDCRKSKAEQQKAVRQYIGEKLEDYTNDQAKIIVKQRFRLSSSRVNYIWSKIFKTLNFEATVEDLQSKGYLMRSFMGEEAQVPELFLAVSPEMTEMYTKWGDSVCYDVTYNLLKARSKNNRQWGVGIFSGIGPNLEIIIFGVSLICNETTISFIRLFKNFIEMMGKEPECFLTDEQLSIKLALKQLRQKGVFSGGHYLDNYHLLKNIKKRTKKSNLKLYRQLLRSRNHQEFEINLAQLQQVQDNIDFLQRFIQEKDQCCFCHAQQRFLGFNASTSRSQKLNDMLKSLVPRQTTPLLLFRQLQKLSTRLAKRTGDVKQQTRKYEVLFADSLLRQVRMVLGKKVFQQFLINYVKGLRMSVQVVEGRTIVSNLETSHDVFENQEGIQCSCRLSEKVGLPCQHIIKFIWESRRLEYIQFVGSRWLVRSKLQGRRREARGRPRKSRRNMMK